MKIARIRIGNGEEEVHYARPVDAEGRSMEILEGDPFQGVRPTGRTIAEFTLLAPIVPAAILCVGLNYRRHAEEMKARIPQWPVLFFKNPSSLQDPGAPILIPRKLASTQVDFEGELALVLRRECRNVTRENALSHLLGYTVANDVRRIAAVPSGVGASRSTPSARSAPGSLPLRRFPIRMPCGSPRG